MSFEYYSDPSLQALLNGTTGTSVYSPELTEEMLASIKKKNTLNTNTNVANTQSDMLRRGGTGSSTEYGALGTVRAEGAATEADQNLQFLLGAAESTAQDRQYKTGLLYQNYTDQLNNWNDQQLANKYMAQLSQAQAAARKKAKNQAIVGGVASLAGAGLGAWGAGAAAGGMSAGQGAAAGSSMGSDLGFLFS